MTTKDSRLTFGKYQGFTPSELAATLQGRNYLDWGKDNLKSPAWRKAFDDALAAPWEFNEPAARKMASWIFHQDDELEPEDEEPFIREYVDNLRRKFEWEEKSTETDARYADRLGISVERLKTIYRSFFNEVSRDDFSTEEKYLAYMEYCREIDKLNEEWDWGWLP
jgi:hypothetical protein